MVPEIKKKFNFAARALREQGKIRQFFCNLTH